MSDEVVDSPIYKPVEQESRDLIQGSAQKKGSIKHPQQHCRGTVTHSKFYRFKATSEKEQTSFSFRESRT